MREIKFRVWDGDKYISLHEAYVVHGLISIQIPNGVRFEPEYDEVIIEQYTGLKADGKKIYEGDILASGKIYWEVVFIDGAFWARRKNGIINIKELQRKRILAKIPIEIIGNIHENGDLL